MQFSLCVCKSIEWFFPSYSSLMGLGSGPQSLVILNVSCPSGFAYDFGTIPHEAKIGLQHGVH